MRKIKADYLIRHFETGFLLETLFVFSVAAALVMRGSLVLLGYPQLSAGDLHIAHVLFGGIFMLMALVVAVIFLNKDTRFFAAAMGGVGFGLFIDELGKFITHDNNYYYQPAFAMIYLVFVLMFFTFRFVAYAFSPTKNELIFNAMELWRESIIHEMDELEKKAALAMLDKVNGEDELIRHLKQLLAGVKAGSNTQQRFIYRMRSKLEYFYARLVENETAIRGIVAIFIVTSIFQAGVSLLYASQSAGFWEIGLATSTVITAALVLRAGTFLYRGDLLRGYLDLKYSVLFSLFIVRFFQFNVVIAWAVVGVVVDVVVVMVINYVISLESVQQSVVVESRLEQWLKRMVKLVIEYPSSRKLNL